MQAKIGTGQTIISKKSKKIPNFGNRLKKTTS